MNGALATYQPIYLSMFLPTHLPPCLPTYGAIRLPTYRPSLLPSHPHPHPLIYPLPHLIIRISNHQPSYLTAGPTYQNKYLKSTSTLTNQPTYSPMNKGGKFLKKLWCCVCGRVKHGNLVLSTKLIT